MIPRAFRRTTAERLIGVMVLLIVVDAQAAREPESDEDLQQAVAAHNSRVELDSQELVCGKEAPVGTRIKKTVCRNRGLLEREQHDARRFMSKQRPVPTKN